MKYLESLNSYKQEGVVVGLVGKIMGSYCFMDIESVLQDAEGLEIDNVHGYKTL